MSKRSKGQQEIDSTLKRLREEAKLTQEQLAYELGISSSTLRRWEKGTEPAMTKHQWDKFCQVVGKKFEELPENLVASG
jgi:putative transcriptional regulator